MAVEAIKKDTVKMKFVGISKASTKTVELPIPLISNSQKLTEQLVFSRTAAKGPLTCDVPLKWAGALLAVGGNWQMNEKLTDELSAQIDKAKESTAKEMEAFAIENNVVEA